MGDPFYERASASGQGMAAQHAPLVPTPDGYPPPMWPRTWSPHAGGSLLEAEQLPQVQGMLARPDLASPRPVREAPSAAAPRRPQALLQPARLRWLQLWSVSLSSGALLDVGSSL